jgi:hypothetical protein
MNIYRNKTDGELYILTHLVHDIHHTNRNSTAGIYATPYFQNRGHEIKFKNKSYAKCMKFVHDNFKPVGEVM